VRTLDEVYGRCRIDDITGCWQWSGAVSGGFPRVYGPDWEATQARFEGAIAAAFESKWENAKVKAAIADAMEPVLLSQPGRRAVWQMASGKPIPNGWRVFGTCPNDLCLNPDHQSCGTAVDQGRFAAKIGRFKNQPNRILANRRTALKRTTVMKEVFDEILLSEERGVDIAARTGLSRTIVSKIRTGAPMVHRPAGGLFTGLGARA
jgi:hypothetical protein